MFSKLISYALVFLVLACLVTAISAAVCGEPLPPDGEAEPSEDLRGESVAETTAEKPAPTEPPTEGGSEYIPRLEAPSYSDARYYSDENVYYASSYGMPNCTCYAWGRAYEILGEKPELCLWDARCWYDYNAENGIYDYGVIPKEGAVACWEYTDGGSGHVAVVESVDNGVITFSNSAYSGSEFYISTAPVSDPSAGMETWVFQGYIYVGEKV